MQQLDFWISKRARQTPNQTALIQIETGETWDYRTLMAHSFGWYECFKERGLKKGDRVTVLMENSITSFAIMFACRMQGLIFVPLNSKMVQTEMANVINDCHPALLIYDEINEQRAQQLTEKRVDVQDVQPSDENDFAWLDEPKLPWMIIYTGGTTGKSKGVVLTYEAVTTNAINTVISWGLSESDCTLNYMPLFHTGGINALSLPILLAGGTVIIGKKFDPEIAIRALDDYRTTISLFVPTMYRLLTDTAYFQQSNFPTVKVFLSGGAPCPKSIYERFQKRGLLFKEGYGLTEAGPNNFIIDAKVAMQKKGAIGKSMLFNKVQLVDEVGKPCRIGEIGELCLKGSHIFLNYWNNEEETRLAFHDGWLKTGDLARIDEDGDFHIVGRKKEMIITGGENVYPQEVEQCLLAETLVEEASVIGIPDEKWGECVVAFVVTKQNTAHYEEMIKAHCKQHLANYKVPKKFYFIKQLPKTVVGKIDKKKLLQMAQQIN